VLMTLPASPSSTATATDGTSFARLSMVAGLLLIPRFVWRNVTCRVAGVNIESFSILFLGAIGRGLMPTDRKLIHAAPYRAIVDRLIARRKELELTQTELGERVGENQAFLSSRERRQRRIDMWEFVRLCRALDLDPAAVINDID
jgi:hypothetical protein